MKHRLNTDEILRITILSLGGTSEFVSPKTRWINFKLNNLIFSTYSMRMPIDSPVTICKADNKLQSRHILKANKIPIMDWWPSTSLDEIAKHNIHSKFVIKPVGGMKGLGVVAGIKRNDLKKIFEKISCYSPMFIEPYIESKIFRILLLNHKIISINERFPPYIVGDGFSKVSTLIERFKKKYFDKNNRNLTKDLDIEYCLKYQNINLNKILKPKYKIKLTNVINISRGASWEAHPITYFQADTTSLLEKATKVIGLKLAGIDLIQKGNKIFILEINPSPGILGHTLMKRDSRLDNYNFTAAQKILSTTIKFLNPEITIKQPKFFDLSFNECIEKLNNH